MSAPVVFQDDLLSHEPIQHDSASKEEEESAILPESIHAEARDSSEIEWPSTHSKEFPPDEGDSISMSQTNIPDSIHNPDPFDFKNEILTQPIQHESMVEPGGDQTQLKKIGHSNSSLGARSLSMEIAFKEENFGTIRQRSYTDIRQLDQLQEEVKKYESRLPRPGFLSRRRSSYHSTQLTPRSFKEDPTHSITKSLSNDLVMEDSFVESLDNGSKRTSKGSLKKSSLLKRNTEEDVFSFLTSFSGLEGVQILHDFEADESKKGQLHKGPVSKIASPNVAIKPNFKENLELLGVKMHVSSEVSSFTTMKKVFSLSDLRSLRKGQQYL